MRPFLCSILFASLATPAYAQTEEVRDLTPSAGPNNSSEQTVTTIPLEEAMRERPMRFIEVGELPPVGQTPGDVSPEDLVDPNTVGSDEYFSPSVYSNIALYGIHKLTGRSELLSGKPGEPINFGTLTIQPYKCSSVLDQGELAYAALIEVKRAKENDESAAPIFRGWLFSSSPSLSSINHPEYDVLLKGCTE